MINEQKKIFKTSTCYSFDIIQLIPVLHQRISRSRKTHLLSGSDKEYVHDQQAFFSDVLLAYFLFQFSLNQWSVGLLTLV